MDNKIEITQNEFLQEFPDFQAKVFINPRIKYEWENVDINMPFSDMCEINKTTPSWLYFTPNWSVWNKNKLWEKIDLSSRDVTGPVNAIVLDFDLVRFPNLNMDSLLEHIKETIKNRLEIQWRYIVKVQKSYQVYFIIDKGYRLELYKKYWHDILKLTQYLAQELWSDTNAKVTKNISALFRIPWSFYWKAWDAYEVEIVWFNDSYVQEQEIVSLMMYLNKLDELKKWTNKITKGKNWADFIKINTYNIYEVIEALELENNPMIKDNKAIGIIWEDIYKYPIWDPLDVVWLAQWWNEVKTKQFLREFLNLEEKWKIPEELKNINWDWFNILFYDTNVLLRTVWKTSKWEQYEKEKIIFRSKIRILWRWYVTSNNIWEWELWKLAYIVEVNWVQRIIEQITTKVLFNRKYPDIFFFWDDNDLWLFFNWLAFCDEIETITIYERSWYYDDVCILWDKAVCWDIKNNKIMLWTNAFSLVNDDEVQQISVREYFNLFKQCYIEEFSVPLFLSALSLWWMNLWNSLEVNPALLLAGKTWCWKSTVASLLKRMLWYWYSVREMALPWVTPQPLKQSASDNAVLFLEELTKKVWPQTEELLRNVVNRDKAARWDLWWNTRWIFRSPIWVNGERTFKDESLNNRFCTFIMTSEYWVDWASNILNELSHYTAYKDVYNTFLANKDRLNLLVQKYKSLLVDKWYQSRTADVWSYVFTSNEIFDIWYKTEDILEFMNWHLENAGLKIKKNASMTMAFERFITVNLINRKINLNIREERYEQVPYLVFDLLFLDDDVYQTNRWIINTAIKEINSKYWNQFFEADEQWLIWRMQNVKNANWYTREWDQYIHDLFTRIISILPGSMATYNRSFMLLSD